MFSLKKIVGHLCMPTSIITILMLLGIGLLWYSRKQRTAKAMLSIAVLLLVLASYGVVSHAALKGLEDSYPVLDIATVRTSDVRTVVVLGGGHFECATSSPVSQLTPDTLVRLSEGIRLQKQLKDARLILSGGNYFGGESDAAVMHKAALALGVDPGLIVEENLSLDTKDQARLIKGMLDDERPLLVTSAYHMPRAMALFAGQGMQPIAAPVGHRARCPSNDAIGAFFPSADHIVEADMVMHEILGIISAAIMGQL